LQTSSASFRQITESDESLPQSIAITIVNAKPLRVPPIIPAPSVRYGLGHENAWFVAIAYTDAMDGKVQTLITGATGLVGSAVAGKLVGEGFHVRALVRPASPRSHLDKLDLEFVAGDIRDVEAVRRAMVGIRYVFHVAADYRLWARYPSEIFATNVDGTRIVMAEARRASVERVVYTSSVATLGLRADGSPADETVPLSEKEGIGAYKRSKIAAERLVEAMVAQDALPAVIVNPSTPIGPRDVKPTPTGRIIVEAARGRVPGFLDTGLNLVHVDDVAEGHLAALKRGAIGERYILGGENVLLADMLAEIARLVGRRPPRLRLPRAIVIPIAYAAEATAWVTGREPFTTLDGIRMAEHRMFFTAEKAKRDLGFRPRPYREALKDAIEWFAAAGYLDGKRGR
jgi:dihydroflavonol-4-reductase